jgi:hypothetical protein
MMALATFWTATGYEAPLDPPQALGARANAKSA